MSDYIAKNDQSVSVAMTTYNGSRYVGEQIASILAQDASILEIIVCDDGSTDNTLEVIDSFASELIHVYVNESNLGYVKNFEKACRLCKGDYIALADQDDIWEVDKLSLLLKLLQKNESVAIFSDALLIDDEGGQLEVGLWESILAKPLEGVINRRAFYMSNCVTGCTFMFKRELLSAALPFPEALPHDWWLAYIAGASGKLQYCKEKHVRYRLHGNNAIGIGSLAKSKPVLDRVPQRLKSIFGSRRLQRYDRWHQQTNDRLRAMFEFESKSLGGPSEEIVTLRHWIKAKNSGGDLSQFREIFYGDPTNHVCDFYIPGKRILETKPEGCRRLNKSRIVAYILAITLICLLSFVIF